MDDGAEYTGRTVEDAIAAAEAAMGTSRASLSIEVLSPGRAGVFGIGAEQARVLARPLSGAVETEEDDRTALPLDEIDVAVVIETAEPDETDEEGNVSPGPARGGKTRPQETPEELAQEAARVLGDLLESMGFDVSVEVRAVEDPIMLGVTGQNLGVLIGRRGDNLSAIQFMVNLILSKNRRQWPRVVVDVENYRARREESLTTLADRIAYRVRRNGRPFTLEAMPAGDRRVIHMALRESDEVETYSIGEGPARRVVIAPKGAAPQAMPGRERW